MHCVLLVCDHKYYATSPVTIYNDRHVDFIAKFPSACTLVGLYHTHPGPGEAGAQFAQTDIEQALALRVPSYIAVAQDASVRIYDPRSMHIRRDPARMSIGPRTPGRIIARIGP
jgi:hypothetical protein